MSERAISLNGIPASPEPTTLDAATYLDALDQRQRYQRKAPASFGLLYGTQPM